MHSMNVGRCRLGVPKQERREEERSLIPTGLQDVHES